MIIFVITSQAPPILLLTLAVMAYLTGYELRKEQDLQFLIKAWWVLFVVLLNILGLRHLLDLACATAFAGGSRVRRHRLRLLGPRLCSRPA